MNIASWLDRTGRRFPGKAALLRGTETVANYAQFRERAARNAEWFRASGIGPGDQVAIYMPNSTAYLECLFGIWWAGAIAVPINAKLHGSEAGWIVSHSTSSLVISEGTYLEELAAHLDSGGETKARIVSPDLMAAPGAEASLAPVPRDMQDVAWIFYTSGTTGRPKGAMLTHANLIAMSVAYVNDVDAVSPDDVALYAAPLSHGAGLYSLVHVLHGAAHCVPESGGFDAAEVFAIASARRNISLFAAPTMVKRLVAHAEQSGADGDGITTIVYGGGPMYLADIEHALGVLGQKFVQIYGQGESPMTITALSRDHHHVSSDPEVRRKLASVGVAQSVVEVRTVDGNGYPRAAGVSGEIEVRGLTVMKGYWRDDAATQEALIDGWLRTGDIGVLDEQGYLTLTDRSKDVIISGGTNIYPREVEEVLLQHPDVVETSVIGEPDPEWGENVIAFVVLNPGSRIQERDLAEFCTLRIARFKRPKKFIFLAELKKNNYGKILKTELRKLVGASGGEGAHEGGRLH